MKRIWAPWRMKYISGQSRKEEPGCIFCIKPKQKKDQVNLILHRGKKAFVMMNLYPYTNGHLMIAPYRHVGDFTRLTEPELLEMMKLSQTCQKIMHKTMRTEGFNLGFNLGRTAGAGIADHIHLHLVPRWNGDTNFMPVISGAKVISEGLEETYAKLKYALGKITGHG